MPMASHNLLVRMYVAASKTPACSMIDKVLKKVALADRRWINPNNTAEMIRAIHADRPGCSLPGFPKVRFSDAWVNANRISQPLGLSQVAFAAHLGVPVQWIADEIACYALCSTLTVFPAKHRQHGMDFH